jgi:thiol:disulfide interchange protein DsbC
MNLSKRIFFISMLFLGILVGFDLSKAAPAAAQCPAVDKVQQGIRRVFPNAAMEVVRVEPAEMPGLCTVQIKMGNQIRLAYADPKGDFILAGNLFEVKTAKNITLEATQVLNKLTPEEMKQLEPLTAFTMGQGKKVLYFVTDPQCPYCKQMEPTLKKLSEKDGVQVRYLLLPLASHKGAREQCISILCDKKGLEGWEKGYKSDNLCPEGTKKIDETVAFLQKKGIQSTPTFILSDGISLSGAVPEDVLRARLGLPKAAPPSAK